MSDLFLVIDNFDGEANLFASTGEVQAFLKRSYQEGPALYQILTDGEKPRLVEHLIPEDWKYIDPDEAAEGESA